MTGHQHEWLPQTSDELRCACGEVVTGLELAQLGALPLDHAPGAFRDHAASRAREAATKIANARRSAPSLVERAMLGERKS